MTGSEIAGREEKGTGGEMSNSTVHHLFRLWNLAAAEELDIRIQGPLLSFPFGVHYRIVYIDQPYDCGLPCRGNPAKPIDPAHTYPGPLDLPTNPRERVYDKYLQCESRQLGQKPAWHGHKDIPTEIKTFMNSPQSAPGLAWESVWAQYWFNQHHHLRPREVLRWHPRTWPSGARPFKKLKIKDCTDRPYFGLHPDIVALILDLTGRVKGLLEHDGLFHPSTPFELNQLIRQADTVTPFRP
jgi:hypothetical protein